MDKYVRKVVYFNAGRDRAILEWLAGRPKQSKAIRDVVRLNFVQDKAAVQIDPANIGRIVEEAVAKSLDLGLIRRMVEAAVRSVLLELNVTAGAPPDNRATEELDDLDEFDDLVMG